jgi:beta-xylosidase
MKLFGFIFFVIMLSHFSVGQGQVSKSWVSDLGNGKYRNPILYADYSDPDVCRVGDDYYMTASSFNCVPGLPLLHSKDLVNWQLVGYALSNLTPLDHFSTPQHGNGVWAPAIRYHENNFYIYWGDPDQGIFMVKSKTIEGPWDEPVLVKAGKGLIDSCPFWDEDGKAYIVHGFAGSRAGVKSILGITEMTADGTKAIGESRLFFDGHPDHPTVEGPKIYKRNGWYYVLAPAGGVATGWQLALRSKNIWGPYESKIVMAQGKSKINGPHQGGWVTTPDGKEDWFIHFQDLEAYGRVIHLNPMSWKNDWPVIGVDKDGDGCGDPVEQWKKPAVGGVYPIVTPPESDNFSSNELGLQWQWHANYNPVWYFADQANSRLRLFTQPVPENYVNLWDVPNLLMQKFPAPNFRAVAKVKFTALDLINGERAGLVVMGMDYAAIVIEKGEKGLTLGYNECKKANKGKEETVVGQPVALRDGDVFLAVDVKEKNGEAVCSFSYSLDGKKYVSLGSGFNAAPGRWIGAKVGFFATRPQKTQDAGYLDVYDFTVE